MSLFLMANSTFARLNLRGDDKRLMQPEHCYPHMYAGMEPDLLWPRSALLGYDMNAESVVLGADRASAAPYWEWPTRWQGVHARFLITGRTLDSNGDPIGPCIVQGFLTETDEYIGAVSSNSLGEYILPTIYAGEHYLVAYKTGAPDIAGTTINTITPG